MAVAAGEMLASRERSTQARPFRDRIDPMMTVADSFPARALLLGERLETRGLERADTIHTNPLTLRLGEGRIAILFRYGVAVFVGLSAIEEDELERLYARLEDEYELVERSRAMERKLALINETVGTLIDLVQNQRSVRLEWYIIGLIGIEILLSLYQLFGPALR